MLTNLSTNTRRASRYDEIVEGRSILIYLHVHVPVPAFDYTRQMHLFGIKSQFDCVNWSIYTQRNENK